MLMMTRTLCALTLVFSLAACGDDGGSATADAANNSADASAPDATTTTRTDVTFTVAGTDTLTGYLTTSAASPAQAPGVLLLHQFMQTDEQWGELPDILARRGYRVLAFNLRGHGDSAAYPGGPLSGILSDPVTAPADVDAALAYLSTTGDADSARIAVIGTSIGANLTVAAAVRGLAKTYVSLSARKSAVEIFAGQTATGMSSVLYFASELDSGGTQAADAQTMHDATTTPRGVQVYSAIADHGISILRNQANSTTMITDWLDAQL